MSLHLDAAYYYLCNLPAGDPYLGEKTQALSATTRILGDYFNYTANTDQQLAFITSWYFGLQTRLKSNVEPKSSYRVKYIDGK